MNSDKNWQEMSEAWRQAVHVSEESRESVVTGVRKSSRRRLWLEIVGVCLVVAVMVLLVVVTAVHGGVLAFTFAIIGFSFVLPLSGYVLIYRSSIIAATLDTSSMLDMLLRKEDAKKNLFEALTILLGIETLMACVFWTADRLAAHEAVWQVVAIFLVGILVTGLAWRENRRAEVATRVLTGLRATL